MQHRLIGYRTVSAIGLGEMPLSIEGRPDRRQAIATIHASLDAGVTSTYLAPLRNVSSRLIALNRSISTPIFTMRPRYSIVRTLPGTAQVLSAPTGLGAERCSRSARIARCTLASLGRDGRRASFT